MYFSTKKIKCHNCCTCYTYFINTDLLYGYVGLIVDSHTRVAIICSAISCKEGVVLHKRVMLWSTSLKKIMTDITTQEKSTVKHVGQSSLCLAICKILGQNEHYWRKCSGGWGLWAKSSILQWHPVLWRFYPHDQRSNKKEGWKQSIKGIFKWNNTETQSFFWFPLDWSQIKLEPGRNKFPSGA